MSPVARFRPFGRRQDSCAAPEPDPWLDDPPVRGGVEPRERAGHDRLTDGWDSGVFDAPATRAATPAMWAPRAAEVPEPPVDDRAPVTDPFGFPPVPPVVGALDAVVGGRDEAPARRDPSPAWAAWVPAAPADRTVGGRGPGVRSPWAVDADPVAAEPATSTADATPVDIPDPRDAGGSFSGGDTPSVAVGHADAAAAPVRATAAGSEVSAPAHEPAATTDAWMVESGRAAAGPAGPVASPSASPNRGADASRAAVPPEPRLGEPQPDPAEASALAGAFAADYLSWDEDDPARRGRALADHLPGPGGDHALLGWSGAGRQRTEFVLPGAVRPDGDGRLVVDVRVRVVPYRRVSRSEATPEPDPGDALGTPAAAPSVTARGWRGLAARWVRLGVTVVLDGDRLVVDVGEEALDEPDAGGTPPERALRAVRTIRAASVEDPTLDGDDVASNGGPR